MVCGLCDQRSGHIMVHGCPLCDHDRVESVDMDRCCDTDSSDDTPVVRYDTTGYMLTASSLECD